MAKNNKTSDGWIGWILFAGLMMILSGTFQAVAGLTALFNPDWYLVTANHVLVWSTNTWGWINLALGTLVLLAGMALLNGATWARVVAIAMALMSAVGAMLSMGSYPIWSIMIIVVDVLVIHAVTVYGGELKG